MIPELRQALVDQLKTLETDVHNMMPARFNPPGIIVSHSTEGNYVAGGQFRGEYEVAFDVVIAVKANENDRNAELTEIDNLIEQVLENTMNWGLRGVEAVGEVTIQGAQYPGTIVHIAKQTNIGE